MTITFSPGFWGSLFGGGTRWKLTLGTPTSRLISGAGIESQITTKTIATAHVTYGFFWATITCVFAKSELCLRGLTNENVKHLLQEAGRISNEGELRREFGDLYEKIKGLCAAVDALCTRDRYIRGFDIATLLEHQEGNIACLPRFKELLGIDLFSGEQYADIRKRLPFLAQMAHPTFTGFVTLNAHFVQQEKANPNWVNFFKTIEKTPLNPEQQEAVVVHENCNCLIAAAGSGKSSTLVAKTGYAIKKGYVRPEEVLVLAFNGKAASEVSKRLRERLGLAIHASTFHSFGLEIIRSINQKIQIESSAHQILAKVKTELSQADARFQYDWLFFKAVYLKAEPEKEFTSITDYESFIKTVSKKNKDKKSWGIPSLQGELVKSFEELSIANWLFAHTVSYVYELPYDNLPEGWIKYEPDFSYLREDGVRVYHEHFALRADGTSPFGASYEKQVKDKRALHIANKTILIETTSAQFSDGSLFTFLQQSLYLQGISLKEKTAEELLPTLNVQDDKALLKLISALLAHAKESGYDEGHFIEEARKQKNRIRAQAFLKIFFPIWRAYTKRLNQIGKVDFADMIGLATKYVESGKYNSPFKLILVDEFQDISPGRAKLVKALLSLHADSVLFGVGDDWQAINSFAGSDLSIMRNFANYFGKTEIRYLKTTFRSNQGISDVSARFVMANERQIKKSVDAVVKDAQNVIRIIEYSGDNGLHLCIINKLDELAALSLLRGKPISVMIIGRYKYETTDVISINDIDGWNIIYCDKVVIKTDLDKKGNLKPLDTIHSSKGLEADFVLIHSVNSEGYAFPSQMESDPLLNLSFSNSEPFPYAEERRLFYVALTRAREQVIVLTSEGKPSQFAIELLDKAYGTAVLFEGKEKNPVPCPVCKRGYLMLKKNSKDQSEFYGCTNFYRLKCDHTMKILNNKGRVEIERNINAS